MIAAEPSDEDLQAIEDTCLEDLFTEVAGYAVPKKRTGAQRQLEAEQASRDLYANPANWTRTRGIALVHRESSTLLGNFSEYTHTRVRECRKLLREESPIAVSAVEYVEGSWWLSSTRRPEPVQVWHERRPAICHVHLEGGLNVHAPGCAVIAFLSYGALARVELETQTRFALLDSPSLLLDLPAGTNLFEILSRDSKIRLMEALGLK